MKSFCAWFLPGAPDDAGNDARARRMLDTATRVSLLNLRSGPGWAVALGAGPGTAELEAFGSVVTLFSGNPRYTDGTALSREALYDTVSRCLVAAREGVPGEVPIGGQYAGVAFDTASATLLAVVDRFASHPIYYAQAGGGVVLGSTPRVVAMHPLVSAELSHQAVFEYMYASVIPAPLTIYEAVRALPSGSGLVVRNGRLHEFVHWRPHFSGEGPSQVGTEREREVMSLLNESVSRSVMGPDTTGCFLSGGIDSSTLTGCFRSVTGQRPNTFSIGFDAQGYDELEFARTVAEHFNCVPHEYYVTPEDILGIVPKLSRAFGQPFGNASVVPSYQCAVLAREHGMTTLLAGDGGDELFGGNERYGRNWLYSLFDNLPSPLRAMLQGWGRSDDPLLGTAPGFRKLLSYVNQASVPLPGRMDVYNYVHRLGATQIFNGEFLATVDPQRIAVSRDERFHGAMATDDVNRMLALDFQITLADNDLRKVTVMCDEAGIDVRFPFLEDELVDFSLALPPCDKVKRTHLRYFFKEAMTGFLPDVVISKTKHGFGLPFGPWAVNHAGLRDWVASTMASAATRGIINSALINSLRTRLLEEHPGYYGPLVWQIAVLECWLQENTS